MRPTRAGFALLAVLLVSTVARFAWLGTSSIWADELFTLDYTRSVLRDLDSLKFILTTGRPVYFLLSAPLLAWAEDPVWAIRVVSAATGVAGIALLWRLGMDHAGFGPAPAVIDSTDRVFGSDRPDGNRADEGSPPGGKTVLPELSIPAVAALCAAGLAAVHPYHLFLSREARYYPLLFALSAASVLAHRRLTDRPTLPRAAWLVFLLAVGCHTHLFFGGVVLALAFLDGIRVLTRPATRRSQLHCSACVFGVLALLNLPLNRFWALSLLRGPSGSTGPASDTTLFTTLGTAPQAHLVRPWTATSPDLWVETGRLFLGDHSLAVVGGALLLVLGLACARERTRPWRTYGAAILLSTWLPLHLFQPSHVIMTRYFIAALPFLILLQGLGAARAFDRRDRPAMRLLGLLGLVLTAVGQCLALPHLARTDSQGWREAVRRFEREAAPEDEVWFFREWQQRLFLFYAATPPRRLNIMPHRVGEAGLRETGALLLDSATRARTWFFQVSYRFPPDALPRFEKVERYPASCDLEPLTLYRSRDP